MCIPQDGPAIRNSIPFPASQTNSLTQLSDSAHTRVKTPSKIQFMVKTVQDPEIETIHTSPLEEKDRRPTPFPYPTEKEEQNSKGSSRTATPLNPGDKSPAALMNPHMEQEHAKKETRKAPTAQVQSTNRERFRDLPHKPHEASLQSLQPKLPESHTEFESGWLKM